MLLSLAAAALLGLPSQPQADHALAFISTNLARGNDNWYTYYRFSDLQLAIKAGDKLTYEIFLAPNIPIAKGGVDIDFSDGGRPMRDVGMNDSEGRRVHGDGVLREAVGKWLTRSIDLAPVTGRTAASWNVVFEGDNPGTYVQFIDNVVVKHADGSSTVIYATGLPLARTLLTANGYTKRPAAVAVDRSKVETGGDLEPLIKEVQATAERFRAFEDMRRDIALAKQFVQRNPDRDLDQHIKEAETKLQELEQKGNATPEEIQTALHAAKHALSHTHPVMTGYTGHLVGHAHIDLQWLWDWQEGIVATRDTFAQAVKFMDEFKGFTFSQSSSCLYATIEDHYPELFKKIQQKVKSGQWELVGGRVCEGDTNMISAESHARHFLYGQRYFRERFGKTAVVGWEPDTFGHALQMPQILKQGGCNYYYFCRGGKGKPLFWWEGLDGTRILTFDEPATGSWYNSDLSYKQFEEMLTFQDKAAGSKDMLWVYGVGNHGGGPTREYVEEALRWMKDPSKPKVRFSTATEFFKKLEAYDLKKIPVVTEELNPVFDGCYTSHSEIKRANRDAEAMTTSAEAVAAVASLSGFKYPRAAFRRVWEDITFHHHHDTLPGSGIHSPYEKTKIQLQRAIADDKDIMQRAMEHLTLKVTPAKGGMSVMVFNPLGWTRSGWVETYLVQSGWYGGERLDPARAVAVDPSGNEHRVVLLDAGTKLARIWAADVPAFGYRVFQLRNGPPKQPIAISGRNSFKVETDRFIVEFSNLPAAITRLYDKRLGKELVKPGGSMGRIELHYEKPQSMSAWVLGSIDRVRSLGAMFTSLAEGDGWVEVSFHDQFEGTPQPSRVTSTFRVENGCDEIKAKVECDWYVRGSDKQPNPMMRVAFDANIDNPVATYHVPFGTLARPLDGKEWPALQWGELGGADFGVAFLNDSKHGYSAAGSTMRISLIRSSFDPDPVPNPGHHEWTYSIYPHAGDWQKGQVTQKAAELNQPLLQATVPFDATGKSPLEWSPVQLSDANVVATGLKVAEDDGDVVVRMYQNGKSASSGFMSFGMPVGGANWVNFLEDKQGAATLQGTRLPLNLRGFEIRTVKVKTGVPK